jgi:hypothetical protein
VVSDTLVAFDHDDIAALALLNCTVAFDHNILLRKLREFFGVNGAPLRLTCTCVVDSRVFDMVAVSRDTSFSIMEFPVD